MISLSVCFTFTRGECLGGTVWVRTVGDMVEVFISTYQTMLSQSFIMTVEVE